MAPTLADEFLPTFEFVTAHARDIAAPAPVVWSALHHANLASAWYVGALLTLRGLRRPGSVRQITLESLVADGGFTLLAERPGQEVALGLVGRFWMPSGGRIKVAPAHFRAFAEPGYAKAVWTFALEPRGPAATRLATQTRVALTDAASRRRFRVYWLVVRPFSGLIRMAMLGAVAREAGTRPV
jgi:hypothetical protein